MKALLQCGHKVTIADPTLYGVKDLFPDCPHCGRAVKLQALEARLWQMVCQDCKRFRAKYFESKHDAITAKMYHQDMYQGYHAVTTDYVVPPRKKAMLRQMFGRSVKLYILDTMEGVRFPESRPIQTVELPGEDSEVPPF